MSLLAYALTNEARFKTFIGISGNTHDTLITRLVNAATEFVENYCDRRFLKTAYSNEEYDGNGSNKILLKNFPVISGETFSLDERGAIEDRNTWDTINSRKYFVKESDGIVERTDDIFSRIPRHYRFTYTAGYDLDFDSNQFLEDQGAGDLEYAIWKLMAKLFNDRKNSTNVTHESLGDYSVSFRREAMIDKEVKEILDKYKRPYQH